MGVFKKTIRRGTPAELALHESGFSASGEGQWSRSAASGHAVKMLSEEKPAPEVAVKKPWADREALLHTNRAALSKLKARLTRCQVPDQIAKLRRQIDARNGYIAKVMRELETSA